MITETSTSIQYINIPNMPVFKIRTIPYKWEEVQDIVNSNQLEKFARLQEGSDKYLKFKKLVASSNLTVFKYLLINQLQWAKLSDIENLKDEEIGIISKSDNFREGEDLKILMNDFPYNFDTGIVHLCIWTKFRIPTDPESLVGDISLKTRNLIEKYLHKTFDKYVTWDNLLWFKNWESLQSVKNLSHVHVIINGLSQDQLNELLYSPGQPLTEEEVEEVLSQ